MKFKLSSCSERYPTCFRNERNPINEIPCVCNIIEINTIEELIEYVKKEGHPVIINESVFAGDNQKDVKWSLETYDDYRE